MSYTVQSIVLNKQDYNLEQAKTKIKNMGYNILYKKKEITEYKAGTTLDFYKFRQINENKFIQDSLKVKKLNNIFLIVGHLKS